MKSINRFKYICYALCFVTSYILVAFKYDAINLFQYFPFDYYELQAKAYSMGQLGLSLGDITNMGNYLFVDMTYLGDRAYVNNGQLISLIYLLTPGVPGVVNFVIVLSILLYYFWKIFEEDSLSRSLAKLLSIFVFSPLVLLFYEVDLFSEISTWYSLLIIVAQYYHTRELIKARDIKNFLACILLVLMSPWVRFELLILSFCISLIPYLLIRQSKYLVIMLFSGLSSVLLFAHNFLIYKKIPSFGDSYGRLHDNYGNYLDFLNSSSFITILKRLYYSFINVFFDQRLFGYKNGVFSIDMQHYSNYSLFLSLTCFALFTVIIYKVFFKKHQLELGVHEKAWLWLALIQFIIISYVSETFFLRYSISYLVISFIILINWIQLRTVGYLVLAFFMAMGNVVFKYEIVDFNFNTLNLKRTSFIERIENGSLIEYGNLVKLRSHDHYMCETMSEHEKRFLLKGAVIEGEKCLMNKNLITPFVINTKSSCLFSVSYNSPIDCSNYSLQLDSNNIISFNQTDENICSTRHDELYGYKLFYVSNKRVGNNVYSDLRSLSLDCSQ